MNKNTKFRKGHIPWNKGLNICLNPKTTFKSGKAHPNFGKRGKLHNQWKGGKIVDQFGYIKLYKPGFPGASSSGYILEHRFKIIKKLKRNLRKNEIIHHIDGNKQNNKLSNLLLLTKSKHISLHQQAYQFLVKHNLIKKYIRWFYETI
jgi:hypothetical protein